MLFPEPGEVLLHGILWRSLFRSNSPPRRARARAPDLEAHAFAPSVILSEASIASAEKDLGQLRASEAGTGFEIAQRSFFADVVVKGADPDSTESASPSTRSFRKTTVVITDLP